MTNDTTLELARTMVRQIAAQHRIPARLLAEVGSIRGSAIGQLLSQAQRIDGLIDTNRTITRQITVRGTRCVFQAFKDERGTLRSARLLTLVGGFAMDVEP